MECMASGTPLLTTHLPSMPEDYYPYVYFFDDESKDGFAKTLSYVMGLPPETLQEKGLSAKSFVLDNKSNVKQAERLIKFVDSQ